MRLTRFCFLFALLLVCLEARAQQQIITATVTLTNTAAGTTNGETISINGFLRTWTNNVVSGNTQILTATNSLLATTNLLLSYSSFPQSGFSLGFTSNSVLFKSLPGQPMSVAISTNWATVSYSTNTIATNSTVMRAPFGVDGAYATTNVGNAIAQYLGANSTTYVIPSNAPSLFFYRQVSLTGVTNFILQIGQNGTNFTLQVGANCTNLVNVVSNFFWNIVGGIGPGSAAYFPSTAFQPACAILSNVCALGTLQGLSYIEGGTGNILLANTNGTERLRADESDSGKLFQMNFEDGNQFLLVDTSHDVGLYDHATVQRLEIDDPATGNGQTVLRTHTGGDALKLRGTSDSALTTEPMVNYNASWPYTTLGATTNFIADAPNVGSSETAVNQFTMPANTMTNVGDTFIRDIGITFNASGSYEVKVYFASSSVFDTGTFTITSSGNMHIRCVVTVDAGPSNSSSVRYVCSAACTGNTGGTMVVVNKANAIDFTAGQLCKIGLIGPASNNAKVIVDDVELSPSPAWGGL